MQNPETKQTQMKMVRQDGERWNPSIHQTQTLCHTHLETRLLLEHALKDVHISEYGY